MSFTYILDLLPRIKISGSLEDYFRKKFENFLFSFKRFLGSKITPAMKFFSSSFNKVILIFICYSIFFVFFIYSKVRLPNQIWICIISCDTFTIHQHNLFLVKRRKCTKGYGEEHCNKA